MHQGNMFCIQINIVILYSYALFQAFKCMLGRLCFGDGTSLHSGQGTSMSGKSVPEKVDIGHHIVTFGHACSQSADHHDEVGCVSSMKQSIHYFDVFMNGQIFIYMNSASSLHT